MSDAMQTQATNAPLRSRLGRAFCGFPENIVRANRRKMKLSTFSGELKTTGPRKARSSNAKEAAKKPAVQIRDSKALLAVNDRGQRNANIARNRLRHGKNARDCRKRDVVRLQSVWISHD